MDQIFIILIACITSTACVLPGTFLVLRKMSLMSDAISHSILLGIISVFLIVKDIHSPILIVGAALTGLLTVSLTELIITTKRLKEDAAIGLVFPVFFSLGVIMITQFANDVHIDLDAVLLGELAFAPFDRLLVNGLDLGPLGLWVMGTILVINALFIGFFYKELKLSTFDAGLSKIFKFSPTFLHFMLMSLTSLTCVGAFDIAGSILVVALIIAPPATAYLITHKLHLMLGLSVIFGILSSLTGYGLSYIWDVSIAGSMATMTGVFFLLAFLFSPSQGVWFKYRLHKQHKVNFAVHMLLVQLLDHEGTEDEYEENTIPHMIHHMGWSKLFARKVTYSALTKHYINRRDIHLFLTPLGREMAKHVMLS